MTLLVSLTLTFSNFATAQTSDTLVYVPEYLMQSLMDDLDQCDLDRIELKKAKAEMALLYVDLAKQTNSVGILKRELDSVREERDTLEAKNMQLVIENGKTLKKAKRSRNWWFTTTIAATLGAIGVHYNWKESWIK
jgi:hypothetical protein